MSRGHGRVQRYVLETLSYLAADAQSRRAGQHPKRKDVRALADVIHRQLLEGSGRAMEQAIREGPWAPVDGLADLLPTMEAQKRWGNVHPSVPDEADRPTRESVRRAVRSLEREGWLETSTLPDDRRRAIVRLALPTRNT